MNNDLSKKLDAEEENEDSGSSSACINIRKKKNTETIYEIDLIDSIDSIDKYFDLLAILRDKEEPKKIILHINNPGGSVYTGISIINAMSRCPFPILGVLDGIAASMGGIILMHCHKVMVEPDSVLMIHHYSSGEWGKAQEIMASVNSGHKVFKGLLKRTYKKFLTKNEFNDIFKGEDLYFSGKDLKERLKRCRKLLEI